jgi:hypothetical protein
MRILNFLVFVAIIAGCFVYTLYRPADDPPVMPPSASADAPAPTAGNPVPDNMKQMSMLYFRKLFVLPDTVLWDFDFTKPYPLGGITVCGRVNFQNSDRVYGGKKLFYTIVQEGKIIDGGVVGDVVDDPVGTTRDTRHKFCDAL